MPKSKIKLRWCTQVHVAAAYHEQLERMEKEKQKIIFCLLVILVIVAVVLYSRDSIFSISDVFIKMEKTDAQYFRSLINDNWEGITSISDEKKEILVANLAPDYAAVGVETMRTFCLALLNLMGGIGVALCLVEMVRAFRRVRSNQ